MKHSFLLLFVFDMGSLPLAATEITAEGREFFESRIRPVLSSECYECHDGKKSKGGLRLDYKEALLAGGDSGAAIVPGDVEKSLLIQSIAHTDEDLKMPKNGAKLDSKVFADFVQWVKMGAPDPRENPPTAEEAAKSRDWSSVLEVRKKWWSFQPVRQTDLPQVKKTDWSAHSVDRFVLANLEQAGLQPAATADRATLIRRATYVINGFPPTPEEVKAFVENPSPNAYEELVDRLLQSPRFGEAWARHWMDWVRYAESYGSEGDPIIPYAWRYRDYLVRAFNDDISYPQMVQEAIAGDLLPDPRYNKELGINESALGIAQLRMVMHGFSPTDTLDEMVTFTDNQIDTVTKAFQALTVSCARCHNHKFDAISQTDFYSLYGIFTSTHPAVIDVSSPDAGKAQRAELRQLKQEIKSVIGKSWLKATEALPAKEIKSETKPVEVMKRWDMHKDKWFFDGQGVSQGATKAGEFSVALDGEKVMARLYPGGVFSDLISPKDRGVLISERFKNEGGTLWIRAAGGGSSRARYIVQNYPRTGTIHKAKEFKEPKDEVLGWHKLDLEYWKGDDVFIQATTVADMPVETKLDESSWFGVSDVVITKGTDPPASVPVSGDAHAAVEAWLNGSMTDPQAELLDALLRSGKLPNTEKDVVDVAPLLAKYRSLEAKLPKPVRAPGVLEADGHDAPLFVRGDHKQPAEIVARRFLDGVDPTPYHPTNSGRLQLADSLVRKDNPFTSRVIVNRLWHHVFGRGLVATTDNFGRLGDLPTHPELLDYLASQFTSNGGSIKQMIKLLVTSKTFQLDDRAPGGVLQKDPENKLLSHFSVRRLEAESIRDSILALTGNLDATMYGESVGGGSMRRSVYVKVIRNNLDDFLGVFDAPVPSSTRGRRDATNVPAQSLTLLNSQRTKDWTLNWGQRISKLQGNDEARVQRMFAEALSRSPSKEELEGCLAFIQYSSHADEAVKAILAQLDDQSRSLRHKIDGVLSPVRTQLSADTSHKVSARQALPPVPYAEWDFEEGLQDMKGNLPLVLEGNARIDHGTLVLDGGKSFARSKPLPKNIKAKTLEAWVMLDKLDQRGGGVLTLQDARGVVFDAIVFAEKDAQCWLAGSDNFQRTQSFKDGPREEEAMNRPVHVALVYQADGTITAYRDGLPYGTSYKSEGAVEFEANDSVVLIGCRHGGGGGNKTLQGRVLRARLYDRALQPDEIAASRLVEQTVITERDVMATLKESQRNDVLNWQKDLKDISEKSNALRDQIEPLAGIEQAWGSLALSLINLKEFIYLK
ncbi:hypothetical protein BH11VER1_BH11VER1_15490 [soil metagenome]